MKLGAAAKPRTRLMAPPASSTAGSTGSRTHHSGIDTASAGTGAMRSQRTRMPGRTRLTTAARAASRSSKRISQAKTRRPSGSEVGAAAMESTRPASTASSSAPMRTRASPLPGLASSWTSTRARSDSGSCTSATISVSVSTKAKDAAGSLAPGRTSASR